jgi:hypothetical protein
LLLYQVEINTPNCQAMPTVSIRNVLLAWRYERLIFGEAMNLLGVSKSTLHRWVEQGKLTPLEDR